MASTQLLSTLTLKSINTIELTQVPIQTLESILYNQPIQTIVHLKDQTTTSLSLRKLCNQIIKNRTRFFTYIQHSPGHHEVSFFTADVSNITIIQAENAEEANKKANSFGIKFCDDPEFIEFRQSNPELYEEYKADDVNRWIKQTEEDGIEDINQLIQDLTQKGGFYSYYIHFSDGTMERVGQCRPAGSHDYFEFWDSYNKDYTNFPKISGLSLLPHKEFKKITEKVQGNLGFPSVAHAQTPSSMLPCLLHSNH